MSTTIELSEEEGRYRSSFDYIYPHFQGRMRTSNISFSLVLSVQSRLFLPTFGSHSLLDMTEKCSKALKANIIIGPYC